MPDDHCPAMLQATAVDNRFGTYRVYSTGRSASRAGHDVLVVGKRDRVATRLFFTGALEHDPRPSEVSTHRAPAHLRALEELPPSVCHVINRYANNVIEFNYGRFKSGLRPMRGLNRLRSVRVISAGHAFVRNLRRGHHELSLETRPTTSAPGGLMTANSRSSSD
jgi:transposase-like protein